MLIVAGRRCAGNDVIRLGESEYDLASPGSGSGDKTTAAQLVRRCISEQLQEVLGENGVDTYLAPVSGSSATPTTSQLASPRIHNIGYETLTRVVRQELRRFRVHAEAAAGNSQHQPPSSDVLRESTATGRGKGTGDYQEIDDVIRDINAREHSAAQAGDGDVDDVPRHAPPPTPLRLDASSSSAAAADHTADDSAIVRGQPSDSTAEVPGHSVRQRRATVDNQRVIRLLERIERSAAELDAAFTALINVGLRCPGDWQRLARELPICKSNKLARHIAGIEKRYRHDVKRQAAAALAEWRSYRRDKATLSELMEALKRCGLLEEAHFLDSMSQESAS